MTQVDFRTRIQGLTWSERTTTAFDYFLLGQVSGVVTPLVDARISRLWSRSWLNESEKTTPSIARQIEDTLSWVKQLGWHLDSPLVIRRFMFENADSITFIQLAAATLGSETVNGRVCGIRVERHPDSEIEELVLVIRSSHYDAEFLSWLDRVREPLAAVIGESTTPMAITSDLQPPSQWSSTGANT